MQSAVIQRSQEEVSVSSVALQLNKEMAAMAESASRALVEVRLGGRRGGAGAGIIWHSKGLIVTNAHVASRGSLRVTLPGGATLPAPLLAHDKERDLAALMVDAEAARVRESSGTPRGSSSPTPMWPRAAPCG